MRKQGGIRTRSAEYGSMLLQFFNSGGRDRQILCEFQASSKYIENSGAAKNYNVIEYPIMCSNVIL